MINFNILSYDADSFEADLEIILLNEQKLLVYCSDFKNKKDVDISLNAFLPKNIMLSDLEEKITKTKNGYYSYNIIGKRIKVNCIECLGAFIQIDDIPNDIKIGENVSFDVIRIDALCL